MWVAPQGLMKCWHQGCSLPTCGDVAAAKICHHANAGPFGQQRRLIQLQGVADISMQHRVVADGLPMCTDGGDVIRFELQASQYLVNDRYVDACQLQASPLGAVRSSSKVTIS